MLAFAPILLAAAPAALFAGRDAAVAPPVPDEAQAAYAAYINCMMDKADPFSPMPDGDAERRALLARSLRACADVRATSTAEMQAKIPRTGAWADQSYRDREIEWILYAFEQRAAFTIVDKAGFQAVVDSVRSCIRRPNDGDCKNPSFTLPQTKH